MYRHTQRRRQPTSHQPPTHCQQQPTFQWRSKHTLQTAGRFNSSSHTNTCNEVQSLEMSEVCFPTTIFVYVVNALRSDPLRGSKLDDQGHRALLVPQQSVELARKIPMLSRVRPRFFIRLRTCLCLQFGVQTSSWPFALRRQQRDADDETVITVWRFLPDIPAMRQTY